MDIKEKLKNSDCDMCKDALFEIIRLESEVMSTNKRFDRMLNGHRKHSDMLRAKITPKSGAGAALNQAIRS